MSLVVASSSVTGSRVSFAIVKPANATVDYHYCHMCLVSGSNSSFFSSIS